MVSKISIEDLAKIREETSRAMHLREGSGKAKITVHMGTCGIASGARNILEAVLTEVEQRGLNEIIVTNSGCAKLCSQEPMMTVEVYNEPTPVKYVSLTPDKVKKIFDSHVQKGVIVKEYALAVGSETAV